MFNSITSRKTRELPPGAGTAAPGSLLARRQTLVALALVWAGLAAHAFAQEGSIHYRQSADMPPGAIGTYQLQRGGPLPGYFQPVEISVPDGGAVSLAINGDFEEPKSAARKAGMLIGPVYRFRVTSIPGNPGLEVFPTLEVINRLYPPLGKEWRFPIQVELTQEELLLASRGNMVTRVIYLEDPQQALPARQDRGRQSWFDATAGEDPLRVADGLGRPMAILRMGGITPAGGQPSPQFLYGSPPVSEPGQGAPCIDEP